MHWFGGPYFSGADAIGQMVLSGFYFLIGFFAISRSYLESQKVQGNV